MPDYKIGELFISAPDEATAKRLAEYVACQPERVIVVEYEGGATMIPITDKPVRIFTRYRNTVAYAGEVKAGSGHKILQAAIDSVNISSSQAAKLAASVKQANRNQRHNLEKKDIDEFESKIPKDAQVLYHDVMARIDASTVAYKLEIISELIGINFNHESWIPILTWFRDKVLVDEEQKSISERRTFFVLRKAFVTAAIRMSNDGVRHNNAMRLVKQDGRTDIDWVKYAQDKDRS